MTHYRLYYLDRFDHIMSAEDLECTDDGAARERALEFSRHFGCAVELWKAATLVYRLPKLSAVGDRAMIAGDLALASC